MPRPVPDRAGRPRGRVGLRGNHRGRLRGLGGLLRPPVPVPRVRVGGGLAARCGHRAGRGGLWDTWSDAVRRPLGCPGTSPRQALGMWFSWPSRGSVEGAALSHPAPGQLGLALLPTPSGSVETPHMFAPASALRPGDLWRGSRLEAAGDTGRGEPRSRFVAGEEVSCLETSSRGAHRQFRTLGLGPLVNSVCWAWRVFCVDGQLPGTAAQEPPTSAHAAVGVREAFVFPVEQRALDDVRSPGRLEPRARAELSPRHLTENRENRAWLCGRCVFRLFCVSVSALAHTC